MISGLSYSYSKTIANLGIKLEEYWNEIRLMKKTEDPNGVPVEDAVLVRIQTVLKCFAHIIISYVLGLHTACSHLD